MRILLRLWVGAVLGMGISAQAQTVIPLINETATGQLGISVKLGTNDRAFTYILDTGSAGFFTAKGTTSAWDNTITSTTTTPFQVSYGTGSLQYTGDVAHTKLTFTTINGGSLVVDNVRMGVITNEPYAGWNADINHMEGGEASPIPPERQTTHLFYGTMGAGLYQTKNEGGDVSSVLGQIPLSAGLTKGFLIHTGGATSTSATLTIGLTQAEMDSFPIKLQMNPSTGTLTNDNGTVVNLYPETQTTAKYTIIKGADEYHATAGIIMDTGGLGTHITTGTNIDPTSTLVNPDGTAIVEGASFRTEIEGITLAQSLDWLIDPTGQTEYLNRIGVADGNGSGSLNSGIALFYNYDVYFDTENGIIGLRAIPEPSPNILIGLGAAAIFVMYQRQRRRGNCES